MTAIQKNSFDPLRLYVAALVPHGHLICNSGRSYWGEVLRGCQTGGCHLSKWHCRNE
jgi:hypothetical protein